MHACPRLLPLIWRVWAGGDAGQGRAGPGRAGQRPKKFVPI